MIAPGARQFARVVLQIPADLHRCHQVKAKVWLYRYADGNLLLPTLPMSGADITQEELIRYRTLEDRIPHDYPPRPLRAVVDVLLKTMDADLDALYARTGRESIRLGAWWEPA